MDFTDGSVLGALVALIGIVVVAAGAHMKAHMRLWEALTKVVDRNNLVYKLYVQDRLQEVIQKGFVAQNSPLKATEKWKQRWADGKPDSEGEGKLRCLVAGVNPTLPSNSDLFEQIHEVLGDEYISKRARELSVSEGEYLAICIPLVHEMFNEVNEVNEVNLSE